MIDPVVKEVWVPASPEEAFRRFTSELNTWWPLSTHSVSEGKCKDVRFETVGGDGSSTKGGPHTKRHLLEEDVEGKIHVWGTVLKWDPPRAFVTTWHPGRGSGEAQEVQVNFDPDGEGTRVRLTHSGWEKLGDGALETRNHYDQGWLRVIQFFAESY